MKALPESAPRSRWFPFRLRAQFSLRTLFVAVLLLAISFGWLTSEWQFVLHRKALAREFNDRIEQRSYVGRCFSPKPTISFWRRWMGDEPFNSIEVPHDATAYDIERAEQLFPEAQIYSALPPAPQS